jgi:hypothetical protein
VDGWPYRIGAHTTTYKNFSSDFVLTPVVKAGDKRRSMLNEHVLGITTVSKHTDTAFNFLRTARRCWTSDRHHRKRMQRMP